MTYPVYCGPDADTRIPTHCGRLLTLDPDDATPAPPPAEPATEVEPVLDLGPSFGGPLFDGLAGF